MERIPRNPVLIIAFNRPDKFYQVFRKVLESNPPKIYISLDGPRDKNHEDITNLKRIHEIINQNIELATIQVTASPINLGCRKNVITSIDWFFDNENQGIILEDDCVPRDDFFEFSDQSLHNYFNDKSIFTISGSNFFRNSFSDNLELVIESKFPNVWGWATWRDRWIIHKRSLGLETNSQINLLFKKELNEGLSQKYLAEALNLVEKGILDTWDYELTITSLTNDMKNLHSVRNLITNIGFDASATHTKRTPEWLRPTPSKLDKNIPYDAMIEKMIFKKNVYFYFVLLRLFYFLKKNKDRN